jgi:hypothetical protein
VSPRKHQILFVAFIVLTALVWSIPGEAQGRRGGRRSGVVVRGGYYGGYPGYFYDPFWYGFGYPFYPYGIGPYPYGYYRGDLGSALRIEAQPKDAEVYVDRYYAGVVDDFDGVFQRLHVAPGAHEITLYKEGFRTVHQSVYLTPDSTFKLRYTMQPLAAGDVGEPRPTPPSPPAPETGVQTGRIRRGFPRPFPPQQEPPEAGPGPGAPGVRVGPPRGPVDRSAYGTLAIRVQPSDATIVIDGERWEGPQGQNRLSVDLPEGPHRVEIEKDGFETYQANVQVRGGDTTPLNVSLRTR